MKLIPTYIFFLFINVIISQNHNLNESLESYFKDYSTAIINDDLESELGLMYPTLLESSSIEKTSADYREKQLKKDTTQVVKKNHLVMIKAISKSIEERGHEYRVIDYIVVKKTTFGKEFLENLKREDSISKIEGHKWICNSPTRRNYSVQSLSYDKETRVGTSAYHERILAIRETGSEKWWFVSKKWWNFYPIPKNTGWKVEGAYKRKHISEINCFIPEKILETLKKGTGYNNMFYEKQ